MLAQNESRFTEDEIEGFKILQRKANNGYSDVDSFLKRKIVNGEPIRVIILYRISAIIHHDIKHQLEEAISFYDFDFKVIILTSEASIIKALEDHPQIADILVDLAGGREPAYQQQACPCGSCTAAIIAFCDSYRAPAN